MTKWIEWLNFGDHHTNKKRKIKTPPIKIFLNPFLRLNIYLFFFSRVRLGGYVLSNMFFSLEMLWIYPKTKLVSFILPYAFNFKQKTSRIQFVLNTNYIRIKEKLTLVESKKATWVKQTSIKYSPVTNSHWNLDSQFSFSPLFTIFLYNKFIPQFVNRWAKPYKLTSQMLTKGNKVNVQQKIGHAFTRVFY